MHESNAAVQLLRRCLPLPFLAGCQLLAGIEPWAAAGAGGAASITASSAGGSASNSTVTSSASMSSSTGTGCTGAEDDCCGDDHLDCLGGTCDSDTHRCGTIFVALPGVDAARIAVAPGQVVVAAHSAAEPATSWHIDTIQKSAGNVVHPEQMTGAVTAITAAAGKIFWALPGELHGKAIGEPDQVISFEDGMNKSVIDVESLAYVTGLGGGDKLCFANPSDTTVGGIYCQVPVAASVGPSLVIPVVKARRLVGNATNAFVLGDTMPNIYGAGGTMPGLIDSAGGFTNDLAASSDSNYWVTDTNLHRRRVLDGFSLFVPQVGSAVRVRVQGNWVYVATTSMIHRYDTSTLDVDPDFLALAAGVLSDLVVDGQGVYWLETLSGEIRVGIRATKSD